MAGDSSPRSLRSGSVRICVAAAAGLLIWLLPAPEGVSADAWRMLAIFVATILGIVLEPMPMGAVALCALAAVTLTRTLELSESLSGFSHPVIWLVVMAFFISRGFIKTGLGARIAYTFMKVLGRRTIGLGYSLVATDLVLAPAIPSITARAGFVSRSRTFSIIRRSRRLTSPPCAVSSRIILSSSSVAEACSPEDLMPTALSIKLLEEFSTQMNGLNIR